MLTSHARRVAEKSAALRTRLRQHNAAPLNSLFGAGTAQRVFHTKFGAPLMRTSAAFSATPALNKPMASTDNFANGTSAVYVDQMYEMWKEDPNSVHASWRAYFSGVDSDAAEPYQPPPSLGKSTGGAPANMDAIIEALKASGIMQGATVTSGAGAADL